MTQRIVVPLLVLAVLIGAAAVALLLVSGDDEDTPALVLRPTAIADSPTATPLDVPTDELPTDHAPGSLVDVPPRPTDFADYPDVIAAYLTAAGDAALDPPCLVRLLAAWEMPPGAEGRVGDLTGYAPCLVGSTDTDLDNEVIVVLTSPTPDPPSSGEIQAKFVLFDRTGTEYRVAFEESLGSLGSHSPVPDILVATGDINAGGTGVLVYGRPICGAHTCTWQVHAITGSDAGYRSLTPEGGLSMATANVGVTDVDGDGDEEIVLRGGIIRSAGAGPQRERTEIYTWDGDQYTLVGTEFDPSGLRYFVVRDADAAFADGDYAKAVRLYTQARDDDVLEEVMYFGSRDELMAYTGLRLGLSYLLLGDTDAASRQINTAIANYPVSVIGQAAVIFRNAIDLTRAGHSGDLGASCHAVTEFARKNLERLEEAWRYGHANPRFDPESVCPF